MIYQCYFAPAQVTRLFPGALYRGFGLEPEVNASITNRCPELESAAVRKHLAEYGAFLHLWRNPPDDGHDWIGFTSYRQLEKFPTVLTEEADLTRRLQAADVLGWGFYRMTEHTSGREVGCAEFSDRVHPGIVRLMADMLDRSGEQIPDRFFTDTVALFCNYWLMPKPLFTTYMQWSWPKVRWAIAHRHTDPYLRSHPRAIGYAMERLFILWYMLFGYRVENIGMTQTVMLRRKAG